MFQPGSMSYTQGFGSSPNLVCFPVISPRAPTSTDVNYPIGKRWVYLNNAEYILLSQTSTAGVLRSNWALSTSISGDIVAVNGTANQITSTTALSTATLSIPSTFIAPGSIAATTTLTATLGNITATNGNIVRGTAGNKDVYTSVATTIAAGANSAGTVALVNGTATVSTTSITASSLVRLYRQGIGTTGANITGNITLGTIAAGVSFVINSVTQADATALETDDQSIIFWEIVN